MTISSHGPPEPRTVSNCSACTACGAEFLIYAILISNLVMYLSQLVIEDVWAFGRARLDELMTDWAFISTQN